MQDNAEFFAPFVPDIEFAKVQLMNLSLLMAVVLQRNEERGYLGRAHRTSSCSMFGFSFARALTCCKSMCFGVTILIHQVDAPRMQLQCHTVANAKSIQLGYVRYDEGYFTVKVLQCTALC